MAKYDLLPLSELEKIFKTGKEYRDKRNKELKQKQDFLFPTRPATKRIAPPEPSVKDYMESLFEDEPPKPPLTPSHGYDENEMMINPTGTKAPKRNIGEDIGNILTGIGATFSLPWRAGGALVDPETFGQTKDRGKALTNVINDYFKALSHTPDDRKAVDRSVRGGEDVIRAADKSLLPKVSMVREYETFDDLPDELKQRYYERANGSGSTPWQEMLIGPPKKTGDVEKDARLLFERDKAAELARETVVGLGLEAGVEGLIGKGVKAGAKAVKDFKNLDSFLDDVGQSVARRYRSIDNLTPAPRDIKPIPKLTPTKGSFKPSDRVILPEIGPVDVLNRSEGLATVRKPGGSTFQIDESLLELTPQPRRVKMPTSNINPLSALDEVAASTEPLSKQVSHNLTVEPLNDPFMPQIKKLTPVRKTVNAPDIKPAPTGEKNRRFIENSVMNAEIVPESMKKTIEMPTYKPITNEETWNKALNRVRQDLKGAKQSFEQLKTVRSADDTALGEALIYDAIKRGDIKEANNISIKLAEHLTEAGQAVQAASILKRMTPEGMLDYANRVINRANRDLAEKFGRQAQKIKLTDEEVDTIIKIMERIRTMPEGRAKDVEFAKVRQIIANKIPASLSSKLAAWQRISLLLNPKTMIRNVLGNVIFGTLDNVKDIIGAPIDALTTGIRKLAGNKQVTRTTLMPSLDTVKTQAKGFVRGVKETAEDFAKGVDTAPARGQFDLPHGRVFQNKVANYFDQLTKAGLQMGDRPFWQAAFDETLRQQMRIRKVSEPTDEMIEMAMRIANERTYQDVNAITKMFQGLKRALNLGKDFGLGNFVIPFTKTPANILKRAIEYSPAGVITALDEAIRKAPKGMFDQKRFVDAISRSVTGSGAIMLGYDLAKDGVITGKRNKDKDVATLERNMGINQYAVNVDAAKRKLEGKDTKPKPGDKYQTWSWAQPVSILLAIGADAFLSGKDRNETTSVVMDAIKSGGNTLFEQSLLQGLQRFLGGYDPMSSIESTLMNAPTSFIPTLGKQAAQLLDPTARSTYSPDQGQKLLNMLKSKVPRANQSLEPVIDTLGNKVNLYQGRNTPLNVLVNPGYSTTYNPTPTQQKIMDLYNQTGETIHFPRVAPKTIEFDGKTIHLSPQEITEYQRMIGEKTQQVYNVLLQIPEFEALPPLEQVKTIQNALTDINLYAKNTILEKRGLVKKWRKGDKIQFFPTGQDPNKRVKTTKDVKIRLTPEFLQR